MPDASLDAALLAVTVAPQRRWRGRLARFAGASPLVPVGMTLGAIAAVVALGIGIGQVLPLPGTEATPTPGSTETPTPDSEGMVIFSNPRDGYELVVPEQWEVGAEPDFGEPLQGVVRFGRAANRDYGALTVSIGSPDGRFYLCTAGLCGETVARTLDELQALVVSVPEVLSDKELHELTELGGEPARIEKMRMSGIVGGPALFYSVFALHDGRPVVLSFDHYSIRYGYLSTREIHQIVASFRFLDTGPEPSVSQEPGEAAFQTLTFPVAGFALEAPAGWWTREESAEFVRFGGPGGEVEVRRADENGRIRALSPPGILRFVIADSVADLRGIVLAEYKFKWGSRQPLVVEVPIAIDGIDATRMVIRPPEGIIAGPGTSHFVLLVRDGRAMILEWVPDFTSAEIFHEVVATFRFLDFPN
jgi:hypothetical protein